MAYKNKLDSDLVWKIQLIGIKVLISSKKYKDKKTVPFIRKFYTWLHCKNSFGINSNYLSK